MTPARADELAKQALTGETEIERQLAVSLLRNEAVFQNREHEAVVAEIAEALRKKKNARSMMDRASDAEPEFWARIRAALYEADATLEASVQKLLFRAGTPIDDTNQKGRTT